MPVLSVYAFERGSPSEAGGFWQNHVERQGGNWVWAAISDLPAAGAVLVWERPDHEVVLDLSGAANTPAALAVLDGLLVGDATRRGPVRTSYVAWANAHASVRAQNPDLHRPSDLIGTLHVDFRIPTPRFCRDVEGTITYYVFYSVGTGGQLSGHVDGWSYQYDGGWILGRGDVNARLETAVPGGMARIQAEVDRWLQEFAAGRRFSMVYLLPGRGQRGGAEFRDDADCNVALAALPL
jgi:hypothetical protein